MISNNPSYGDERHRPQDRLRHLNTLYANLQREIAAVEQDQQISSDKKMPQLIRLREELDRAEKMIREFETLIME